MKKRRFSAFVVVGLFFLAAGAFYFLYGDTFVAARSPRDLAIRISFGSSQAQRDAATVALQNLGSNSVPELVEMLQAETPFYQPWLAELALLLPQKPQDALFRNPRLLDGSGLRLSATRALAVLGPTAHAAVPNLTTATKDSDSRVSLSAIRALGKIGGEAFPVLTNALFVADPDVRRQAAYALSLMGSDATDAVPLLVDRLRDSADVVETAAKQSLERLRNLGVAVPPSPPPVVSARELARDDLKMTRRGMLPAMHDFAWQQRDPTVLPVLTATLGDSDSVLREWAANALGNMGACGSNALPRLNSLLEDHERHVRMAATNALKEIQRALGTSTMPCAAIPQSHDGGMGV